MREIFFSLSGCPLPKIDVYLIWVGTKVKKRTKTLQNVIVWEEEGLNPPFFELDPKHPFSHIFLAISDSINFKIHVKKVKLKGVIVHFHEFYFFKKKLRNFLRDTVILNVTSD